MAGAPLIEARKLTKRYGEFVAVDGIEFTVARGETFGFLGPNGAGKSSTMRMIGAVSPASGGTLRVLGLDPERDGPAIRAAPRRRPAGGQPRPGARRRREPPRLRPLLRPPPRRDPPSNRRAARVRPARRPARGPRRLALGRDEAPADHRAGARQRARADAPRRADDRSRSAGAARALGSAVPAQAAGRDPRPDDALHGRGRAALRSARDHGPREDRGRGVAARADRALRRARGGRAPLRGAATPRPRSTASPSTSRCCRTAW